MDRKRSIPLKNVVWQIVVAFLAHTINIQPGINMAYSTILLPQIMNSTNVTEPRLEGDENFGSKLTVDQDEASWIASLMTIATPIGSLLTGPLMDRFGRKNICIFASIPFIISWALIATTDSVYTIYGARVLAGVAGGLATAVIVYVSEISHPSIRPMLLSLTSVFVSFGILLTLFLNYFFNWKIVAVCCGALAFSSLIMTLFTPESPSWIVGMRVNDEDPTEGLKKAELILKWLYKNPEDYQTEYNALVKIKEQKTTPREDALFRKDVEQQKIKLSSPQVWKPLVILFFLFTLQQLSGVYLVIFYAVQIFEESGSVETDKHTSVIILGVIRFVMAIISMFLSKRFGRRPLLLSSGAGMVISILFAAAWIYFSSLGLVPVICLLTYVLFASYGVMVIPWTLIGELLPLSIRGKGSGFMVAIAYVHMFVTVKMFIFLIDYLGIVLIFICFSAFSILFCVFVFFKIPETLGKSFQEIENHFK